MGDEVERVLRFVRRWGVRVELGYPVDRIGFCPGPIAGGIHWPTKTIWWPLEHTSNTLDACALLHELSHILSNEHPQMVDEIRSGMLAFEREAMKVLRLPWSEWMLDFALDDSESVTWDMLSTIERGRLLKESRHEAIQLGIMNLDGRLTYSRYAGQS